MRRLISVLVPLAVSALPMGVSATPADQKMRQEIFDSVDENAAEIADNALKIWQLAEPGFKETQSSRILQRTLEGGGFEVVRDVAGMPTAFVARYRTGNGPVIAIMAEFDALPGISQNSASVSPEPIAAARAGHACGHNLLGAGAVGAAIAVAKWMKTNNVQGEIRVYGAPAEEGGDGKSYMVRAGLFRDVDAVLHWHPDGKGGSFVLNGISTSNIKTVFTFHGVSSHAGGTPWKGRSAFAGMQVMDVAVNYMRQFVPDNTRIHGVVVDGGKAPNVIPATASISYYVRHPDLATVKSLQERMIRAAQGAATATETSVTWEVEGGVYPLLLNDTLNRIAQANLEQAAAELVWSDADKAYIAAIQKELGVDGVANDPHFVLPLGAPLASMGGSTDVGDISYVVPTVGFMVSSWPAGSAAHSWASAGASANPVGIKGAVMGAKAIATTAIELMNNPAELAAAKAELARRTGPEFSYEALFGARLPALDFADAAIAAR